MNQRIYHGNLTPIDLANALLGYFHRGNWRVQQVGDREKLVVQIATQNGAMSGGQTALSVILQRVTDGVSVQIGEQAWLGVAASLGQTACWPTSTIIPSSTDWMLIVIAVCPPDMAPMRVAIWTAIFSLVPTTWACRFPRLNSAMSECARSLGLMLP